LIKFNTDLTKQLLIACKGSLRRISLDTEDFSDVYLPVTDVHNSVAIDYDYFNSKIYYTDVALSVIRSFNFDGSNVQNVIQKDLSTPNGIAFDWVAKNLYWSDASRNVIEVSRSDGTCRKVIIDLDLDEPRALALLPEMGYIFWGDSGTVPKIERGFKRKNLNY
jgi:sugar lactone lactonase YvrE